MHTTTREAVRAVTDAGGKLTREGLLTNYYVRTYDTPAGHILSIRSASADGEFIEAQMLPAFGSGLNARTVKSVRALRKLLAA